MLVDRIDRQAGRPRNLLRAHGRQQQPKAFFLPPCELLDRHNKIARCTPGNPALAVSTVQLAHERSLFISASAPFLSPRCWIETRDRRVISSTCRLNSLTSPLY